MPGGAELLRYMLIENVVKPLGGENQDGPFPDNVRDAAARAESSNELAARLQERFAQVQELIGQIVIASEATLDQLKPAVREQEEAHLVANAVFEGTRNSDAKSALHSMDVLAADTPPLFNNTAALAVRSRDFLAVLGPLGEEAEGTVAASTIDVNQTIVPLLMAADTAAQLTIDYTRVL